MNRSEDIISMGMGGGRRGRVHGSMSVNGVLCATVFAYSNIFPRNGQRRWVRRVVAEGEGLAAAFI